MARSALFTIGYQGLERVELIVRLAASRVSLVIDVRELPLSRRRGFSKTPLGAALATAGIDYVHVRAAGNPYRHEKDPRQLLARYAQHLAGASEVIDEVAAIARGRRAALLCYEADAATCHRSVLAAPVASRLRCAVRDL